MSKSSRRPLSNPGFLLIEIQCALLVLVMSALMIGQYRAFFAQKQAQAGDRLGHLYAAHALLDAIWGQNLADFDRKTKKITQRAYELVWSDGASQQVWQVALESDHGFGPFTTFSPSRVV